jgi:hypothetical protein
VRAVDAAVTRVRVTVEWAGHRVEIAGYRRRQTERLGRLGIEVADRRGLRAVRVVSAAGMGAPATA